MLVWVQTPLLRFLFTICLETKIFFLLQSNSQEILFLYLTTFLRPNYSNELSRFFFVFTSPDKTMTPEVLEDNLMPKVGDAACSLENGNNNRKHGKALFSIQLGSRKPRDGEILLEDFRFVIQHLLSDTFS